ncbi:conserved Plasmodium protein, unknown function [Plasmodium knowlesi strain H]|uniref:BSD domain-containing protein n=2 Tax=Plasmodium knowlesi TaxID=5850 RepID=B3L3W0_PLAKH|nr:conserved Plasmodium protein, unknown function [Plasmodium knowlesi strain H]OTN65886.1 Uncharacterized protein PKNOH_S100044800 [Plasmodium knowlesi]CAA9987811.1 conserved Plasmodium protein, unknown function [Plasmodium knowlesi strain H]VVS77285.1 conserved Plasmodium protein, unknown function [Plasmodium knowlesi strain H]|eukprot:XP_002258808.1 hypothetical protein, conserved in Plasmodium species [Plasmodium knowlesi strain H]
MEEEKVHASFEVLYNNEKGELYVTSRYLVYISEKTKKEKDQSNSLFLIDDIDLKLCVFSWKKTEKSKKKSKTRFTFAITNKKNNFCFHDYNNTESFIFEFFYDQDNNKVCQIINTLNRDNIKNHIYIEFNLDLIRDKYKVYEESSGAITTKAESRGIAEEERKGDHTIDHVSREHVTPKESAPSRFVKKENDETCGEDKDIASKGDAATRIRHHGSVKNRESSQSEDSDHSEQNSISEDNAKENESLSSLHKMLETDAQLKSLYQMCIQNNILTEKEFYKIHKSDIYEYRNISSSAEEGILKEPLFITEEQKMAKSVEMNKQISRVILSENRELKKLYDYYMANNILSESKFWFFLFNNKYSHLFFYDKNEKDIMGNKNFFSIKSDQQKRAGGVSTETGGDRTDGRRDGTRTTDEEENTYYKNLSLSYDMDNPNQDIKGTLEKCILKEYLSTKSYKKKNILFNNNYYLNEESAQGFGLFTNEKYSKGGNSQNLLINKFNNYCIGMIKDKKFTLDSFYEDLKNKIEDTDLNPMKEKKELQFQIEKKKKKRSFDEADNEESAQVADRLNQKFATLLDQLNTFKQNAGKKNYTDLFNIGRLLFVSNTKKCQSNQSMLIGTIEYEQHILDIVKDYHVKVNYLLNLFYTSCIPEQDKRNKILENLSKIKEEVQAKQEEYNSVLIMGKPLLIHLFEQISICKKFNEKLDRYIQEKRKKA